MESEKNKKEKSGIPISFTKITAIVILGLFIWIVLEISSQKVDLSFVQVAKTDSKNPGGFEVQVGWLLLLSFACGYIFSKLPLKLKL